MGKKIEALCSCGNNTSSLSSSSPSHQYYICILLVLTVISLDYACMMQNIRMLDFMLLDDLFSYENITMSSILCLFLYLSSGFFIISFMMEQKGL